MSFIETTLFCNLWDNYKASFTPSGAPLKTNLPTKGSLHFFQITVLTASAHQKRCLMLVDAINSRENNLSA